MTRTIWVEGCYWETAGIICFMAKRGLSVRPLLADNHPASKDVVIVASSSAPLLGWGQYLCRMEQLAQKYHCTLIALHPPGMKIIPRTPRTYLCDGKVSPEAMYNCLMNILLSWHGKKSRGEVILPESGKLKLAELPGLSERFRHTENQLISQTQKQQCGDLYRERQRLTSRAGFRCIHNFRLFITGVYFPGHYGIVK